MPPTRRLHLPVRYPDPAAAFDRIRAGEAVVLVFSPHDWETVPGGPPEVGAALRVEAAGLAPVEVCVLAVAHPTYGSVGDAVARAAGAADAEAFRHAFYPLLARHVDITDVRPFVAATVQALPAGG